MSPAIPRNASRYIIFSVFFSARAYYPVLAILFLDLGLSLEQFVWLNMIWAATIFCCEVPSGALADTWGRRRLLMAASVLMLVEMLCLLLAPRQGGGLLLALCVLNRLCSGLSEACASGADEALAYDSLPQENRAQAWDQLMARAMRWRAVGFVVAMLMGGLLYDPSWLNRWLPDYWAIPVATAQRLPVFVVLCQALICLFITWRMQEPGERVAGPSLSTAFALTLATARWVWRHPSLRAALAIGIALDVVARNFATINSSYFRLIELPEWTYGLLGAAVGLLSWAVPGIALRLNQRFSLLTNLALQAVLLVLLLAALAPAWPLWGLVPATALMLSMGFCGFTLSRLIHQEVESSQRATALSVKGLVFNLGYGLMSLVFSALLAQFPDNPSGAALRSALFWQVPATALVLVGLLVWAAPSLRRSLRRG